MRFLNYFLSEFLGALAPSEEDVVPPKQQEIIKKKEQLLKKIGSICSKDTGKLFYHIPSKKLLIINFISGEIKFISPESIGFSKEDVMSLDKINYTWENVIFCDARRFFKIMSDKESPVK